MFDAGEARVERAWNEPERALYSRTKLLEAREVVEMKASNHFRQSLGRVRRRRPSAHSAENSASLSSERTTWEGRGDEGIRSVSCAPHHCFRSSFLFGTDSFLCCEETMEHNAHLVEYARGRRMTKAVRT
jgi:hypothetical protein